MHGFGLEVFPGSTGRGREVGKGRKGRGGDISVQMMRSPSGLLRETG